MAPAGNIGIAADQILIQEARETSTYEQKVKFKQSGITVSMGGALVTAVQTAEQMSDAAGESDDPRIRALGLASAAISGYRAYQAMSQGAGSNDPASQMGGLTISVNLGKSESESYSWQRSNTAAGSSIAAGGNITLLANTENRDGNITIQGSDLTANKNMTLVADRDINLLAAGVDPSLTTALTALASTAAGGIVGGTTGAGTAFNEVTNNYLKHAEITELLEKENACFQKGGDACKQWETRKAELKAVSEKRNEELKTSCADAGSSACQAKQQELRSAFAEILRESATGTSESYWASSEVFETWRMATGSLPTTDLVWAIGKTMVTDFIAGIKDMTPFELQKSGMKELWTIIDNDGHLDNTTTGAVIDLASNPALAMAMLQGATREQVLNLADAYERGDSDAIGKLQGQMLSIALSVGGGGAGTAGKLKNVISKAAGLKKVEKAVEEAAQAAKVASAAKGTGIIGQALPSVDELSRAASSPNRNGLTDAGRSLQKHSGREGSVYSASDNKATTLNRESQLIVDDILTNPSTKIESRIVIENKQKITVIEARAPDGRVLRFNAAGTRLIGFREP